MIIKALKDRKGEGYLGSGVKILIAIVIGSLLLGGIYAIQRDAIVSTVTTKVEELFDYNGDGVNPTSNSSYEVRKLSPERVGPDDNMTITIAIPYSEFDYYTVDGEIASTTDDYYVCDDGGYVSFIGIPPYLNTLSPGSHTLRAYAKDGGFGEATFIIE